MSDNKVKRQLSFGQFIILVIIATTAYWYITKPKPLNDPNAKHRSITARGDLAADEKNSIDVFSHSSPSVVYITSRETKRDHFTLNVYTIPKGAGSGFIWDDEGRVVTNYHVIEDANQITVTLSDNTIWKARLVGAAPDKDIAVLQIDANGKSLTPIPIGDSRDLMVGQKVYAIGNPFGLDQTMTSGIVSALGREIKAVTGRTIQGVIQTDAAINPGNSGGPLLDSAGRLIGVNTAIYSPSGASAGIGFAVPVEVVGQVVPELIRHGKLIRPSLGVSVAHKSMARRLGVNGVLIIKVKPGSGAEEAGLHGTRRIGNRLYLGDVIVSIENKGIETFDDMLNALDGYKSDDMVTIGIVRDSEHSLVKVRLSQVR
jgi:S1-C subfamily serine protease